MSGSRFSSRIPKGEGWGVEDAIQDAATEFERTGTSPLIPCIAVIGIEKVVNEAGEEGPERSAVAKLVRIEALTTGKAIRDGQKLILRALQARSARGGEPMLPFESDAVLRMAFGGVNVDEIEQDEREEIEDQNLNDLDRLRRHLVVVHGRAQQEIDQMEVTDIRELHDVEHNRQDDDGTDFGFPAHNREWWEWRRVAIAEVTVGADPDDEGSAAPDDARQLADVPDTGDNEETADRFDPDQLIGPDDQLPEFREPADGETEN